MNAKLRIRNADIADLPQIVEIYNSSILGGIAVAEMEPVKVEDRLDWFYKHTPHKHPLWVLQCRGNVLGWISVQPYYSDPAFLSTAEVSVHIAPEHRKQGYGTFLITAMISECPKLEIATLLGFAFADNAVTARLNERVGLKRWGYLPKTAWIRGRSFDLVIYGINIQNRSNRACFPPLSESEVIKRDVVADHYDSNIEYEALRLETHSPFEFTITLRNLKRLVPPSAIVADIGVGVGHYAEALAALGCSLHLCDISSTLLNAAVSRLEAAGLRNRIHQARQVSAVSLNCIDSESCDAALLLGPLYHLVSSDDRHRAVAEAARILKPGGVIFAAGINRLAYFKDLLRSNPRSVNQRKSFHRQFLLDGVLDKLNAPQIGVAYLTTAAEFQAEFANIFKEVSFLGVESFAGEYAATFNLLSPTEQELWLELVEATASCPEGVASANHFLFIGTKT
jgi:L-amino acid N-acyltransferase YncA/SAM-dependent methyltransferase